MKEKNFLDDKEKAKDYFLEKFPYSDFREGQKKAIKKIAEALCEGYKYIVLDAPTGAGKSAINTAFARGFQTCFYTTPQNSLVDQIENDEVLENYYKILKGKGNYQCQNLECKEFRRGEHDAEECLKNQNNSGRPQEICCDASYIHEYLNAGPEDDPTFADANRLSQAMQRNSTCEYPRRLWEALQADNVLTNTFLFSIAPFFGKKELAIIDESHNLENVIFNFVDIRITANTVPFYGEIQHEVPTNDSDQLEEYITDDLKAICESRIDELEEQKRELHKNIGDIEQAGEAVENIEKKLRDTNDKLEKIEDLMRKIRQVEGLDEDFVIDEPGSTEGVILKPVYCGDFFQKKIAPKADRFILSSATFNNAKKTLEKLGVDRDDVKVISVESIFPVDNRPIHFRQVTDMRRKNREDGDFEELASEIISIMAEHRDSKGIVHCGSYKRKGKLKQQLETLGVGNRLMTHKRNNSDQKLEEFKNREDNSVFLSVGKEEGVDLEEEHARFNILIKMPNPDMGDERISYRVLEKGEWDWYFTQTAISTAQSYGRTTRSETDWSDFYILDSYFAEFYRKNKDLLPNWFREAIVNGS